MVDFDDIDNWEPGLTDALSSHLPDSVRLTLETAAPKYVEDSRDLLFDLTDRDAIIDATLTWIRSTKIAGYHGSRLVEEETAAIQAGGLIPLRAEARRNRLLRAFSQHPKWHEVEGKLDTTISDHGPGRAAGRREGQVHLTLSRAALTDHFDHYLTHGSEFDQRVAYALLGPDGKQLLAGDGKPTVIQVAVSGSLALEAAHPHFGIDAMRAKGDVPNLVDQFLEAWTYRLAYPGFQSRTLKIDCGMVFRSIVPAAWIVAVETLGE